MLKIRMTKYRVFSFKTFFNYIFRNESLQKYVAVFSFILIISLLAELFLFNYKWICSSMNKPEYPEYTIENAVKEGDRTYKSNGEESRLIIRNIDMPLSFLKFNIAVEGEETIPVTICAKTKRTTIGSRLLR